MRHETSAMERATSGRHIRALVVDDHPLFRYGLTQLLAASPGLEVCGEAADVATGLRMVRELRPDVVIVDLTLGGQSGIQLIKDVRVAAADVPVLVLSVHAEDLFGERALRAGASGYLVKDAAAERIVDTIRRIVAGEIVVSSELSSRMLRRVARAPHGSLGSSGGPSGGSSAAELLSDRELEIFELLGRGSTGKQIAAALYISAKTVDTHRLRIKEKLNLDSAHALLRAAMNWVAERKPD